MSILRATLGIGFLLGIAFALSNNRSRMNYRIIVGGITLQVLLAIVILRTGWGRAGLDAVSQFFLHILDFGNQGAAVVFGPLVGFFVDTSAAGTGDGSVHFFSSFPTDLSPAEQKSVGILLAFRGLPLIIYFSALMGILYHLGVMQLLIGGIARVLSKTMRVTGVESMAMAANIFVGQTEAPLVVRPYIGRMTQSELMALMTGGFATVAGSVLGVYIGLLGPEFAGHLMAASFMSAPAAFVIAKMMYPETETPKTTGDIRTNLGKESGNVIEAAANGAITGMRLYLNVLAMLIAFVALMALLDWFLGMVPLPGEPLSLSRIFGWVFAPLAFSMGIPWSECSAFGSLLGTKVSLNEFIAYTQLATMPDGVLSERSTIIAGYALCGFANFGSIGVQIGGLTALAPDRTKDFARLGLRAMVGGFLASCMTATIAGAFLV